MVLLPSYKHYWAPELRYSQKAVMPHHLFQQLLQYLDFIKNNNIDKNDKLAIIKPSIEDVCNEFVKVEPKEFHSIDKQIIPSKTKFSSIHQYNPKKAKKWGFKNLVKKSRSSGFMYDFYTYEGKIETNLSTMITLIHKSVPRLLRGLPRSYQV